MKKNFKLIKYPDCKHKVEVALTPLGDKIKYRITGSVYCSRQKILLPNSRTLHRDDLVWTAVFGTKLLAKKFQTHAGGIVANNIDYTILQKKFHERN